MKKKSTKNKKTKKKQQYNIYLILSIIVAIGLFISFIYLYNLNIKNTQSIITHKIKSKKPNKQPIDKFEEQTKALQIEYSQNIDNNIYISDIKDEDINSQDLLQFEEPNLGEVDKLDEQIIPIDHHNKKQHNIAQHSTIHTIKQSNISKKQQPISNKPKLAIIIDDVTTSHQINKIKQIGYIVNISFLPPTSKHTKSAKIAQKLIHYMIHLPLQASSFQWEEENTLHIHDSLQKIESRIKQLKQLYPNTKFINNHTGSKFTSNQQAMDKLFRVLKKYNYIFIDSRTTAKTVAKTTAKKYGLKLFSRNVFLDNKKDKKYIKNQLKKAIHYAKKYGVAIAIGHPYNITFTTLKESKNMLKDVKLVYVDQL